MVAKLALTCAYGSHQSTSVQANSHSFVGVLWCCLCVRIDSDPDATRKHLGPASRQYPDRGTSSCPGTLTPASTPNDVDLDCWVEWSSMAPRPPLRSSARAPCCTCRARPRPRETHSGR